MLTSRSSHFFLVRIASFWIYCLWVLIPFYATRKLAWVQMGFLTSEGFVSCKWCHWSPHFTFTLAPFIQGFAPPAIWKLCTTISTHIIFRIRISRCHCGQGAFLYEMLAGLLALVVLALWYWFDSIPDPIPTVGMIENGLVDHVLRLAWHLAVCETTWDEVASSKIPLLKNG